MKAKVSITVDRDRLRQAQQLVRHDNVSALVDEALEILIVSRLEAIHAHGYDRLPQGDETLSTPDPAIWSDLPWDDE